MIPVEAKEIVVDKFLAENGVPFDVVFGSRVKKLLIVVLWEFIRCFETWNRDLG